MDDKLDFLQGTLDLMILQTRQHRRLIEAEWGTSDNNRRACFYSVTARGCKQLEERVANWQHISNVMDCIFDQAAEEPE